MQPFESSPNPTTQTIRPFLHTAKITTVLDVADYCVNVIVVSISNTAQIFIQNNANVRQISSSL